MTARYSRELDGLPATYARALKHDIQALRSHMSGVISKPLIVIGSGGALSVAKFAGSLHEELNGRLAQAMTPFGFLRSRLDLRETAVMCLSAGGKNPDILRAFEHACRSDPSSLAVICGRPGAPLLRRAAQRTWVHRTLIECAHLDGFLATHSVVAISVLIARAISKTDDSQAKLPSSLAKVFGHATWQKARQYFAKQLVKLAAPRTLVVLHDPRLDAAATDIESRLTEAALSNVSLSDHRNFGHGRHHWLAKHPGESAVLSLALVEESEIVRRTLALIPPSIPTASILYKGGTTRAALAALVTSILIPETVAPGRGIDPAKPGVPEFGRKLYRLGALKPDRQSHGDARHLAIERKTGTSISGLKRRKLAAAWISAYDRYMDQLESTSFDALVLDYDGTLCDAAARYDALQPDVIAALAGLVERGITVAIATGRGDSAITALRAAFKKALWPQILAGLNNGSRMFTLDAEAPLQMSEAPTALISLESRLRQDPSLVRIATVRLSGCTISLRPRDGIGLDEIGLQARTISQIAESQFTVRESTHSVDVAPRGITKTLVLDYLRLSRGITAPLAIGDRGDSEGNDFDLLHATASLSVDRVSTSPDHCWNVAPLGCRFVQGTRYYLGLIRPERGRAGSFRLKFK